MKCVLEASSYVCEAHYHNAISVSRTEDNLLFICRIQLVKSRNYMAEVHHRIPSSIGLVKD
jgi:hypothetical protein